MRNKTESGRAARLVLFGALAVGAAWMVIASIPDLARYITIRKM